MSNANHLDELINKLSLYIINHSDEKITLESCSKVFNYNSDYLGKLFRIRTGDNFMDFVIKVKMEKAKTLITSGKYKNYEVSQMIGYKDYDYFCKLFKYYSGFTPSNFKKYILSINI